jgi:CPA1 family monovalent cation:H+ antiporter
MRDLIIFLTSGTILLTLIIANFALPILAKQESAGDEETELRCALIAVLEATLERIRASLKADEHAPYVPALRLVAARYRNRLFRERLQLDGFGDIMAELMDNVLDLQQKRADELQAEGRDSGLTKKQAALCSSILRGIRQSIGYTDERARIGSRFHNLSGQLLLLWDSAFSKSDDDEGSEESELVYYQTCLFAIELERVAIDYLEGIASSDDLARAEVAQVLANEHQSACESLWGRINYQQDIQHDTDQEFEHRPDATMPADMRALFNKQLHEARKHASEADAYGLTIELEEISRLRANGKITKQQARELRENVYLMQMSLEG